jgi:FdhE protein
VAGDFLRKLLGGRAAIPPQAGEALAELARLGEQRPTLAAVAAQLGDVLPALYAEPVHVTLPPMLAAAAADKLAAGVPLLRGETLDIDWKAFRRRWQRVVERLGPHRTDATPALADAVRSGRLDGAELTAAVLAGQPRQVHERAEALGLDVPLTASVLGLTLFPVLSAIRAELEPLLGTGSWAHGYCPVCGSYPTLGEFRGLEQTRVLRCGLCAAGWPFARLCCPGCGNRDHRQLGYLHIEGEEGKCRAATCEVCRQYVKMVSTLTALSPPQVLVADVATLHLDLAAGDQGFRPLTGNDAL